ncbi:menaquinone-dependent protoporphyrinogen IX dehydrogenase [Cesiribacter andamanensis]|uniref:Protoporphyrinogen IX dehydrogenase [quinone] n=1 Tax=Cesiribacter andamanensis AMV16 TaxID=1279009 RepID=M7N2A4_9BACT|nr:menaquinone-dependent protoporphyrinogen IX dehydrogenase [Cesiribacter andamanensis]EMR02783.1 Protoporphyrinogen IX dehydrogenase [Cesiribacter andamanensis AMV16]
MDLPAPSEQVLIVYSTTDGHTRKICQRLQQGIEQAQHTVQLLSISALPEPLPSFDRIIIGASVRYGKHSKAVGEFMEAHKQLLMAKPAAFFSVNLVGRKPQKASADTNPYLKKFLLALSWRPALATVFAGRLDYPSYFLSDRLLIRLIMWMTGGPTDPATVVEYTDWKKVDEFGRKVLALPTPTGRH